MGDEPKDSKESDKQEADTPEEFIRPAYTPQEIAEIDKRVEQFKDETPDYNPQNILSPEYNGTSNYEAGILLVRQETEDRLRALKQNPDANKQELFRANEDLKTLDHLYENYNIGMNVFRTAHGGRAKLRK